MRVVLAGHSPPVRAALRLMVEGDWDWQVVGEASDGLEAVRVCRQRRPDVVLLEAGRDPAAVAEVAEMLRAVPTVVVLLLDSPAQHVSAGGLTMLKGVPSGHVRQTILEEARRLGGRRRAG